MDNPRQRITVSLVIHSHPSMNLNTSEGIPDLCAFHVGIDLRPYGHTKMANLHGELN